MAVESGQAHSREWGFGGAINEKPVLNTTRCFKKLQE